jgi:hypothetical protein
MKKKGDNRERGGEDCNDGDDDDDDDDDDDEIEKICCICMKPWGSKTVRRYFYCHHIICHSCFVQLNNIICPFCRALSPF